MKTLQAVLTILLLTVVCYPATFFLRSEQEKVYTFEVKAFHVWQHTFIECEPGDRIEITATGQWSAGMGLPPVGPSGYSDRSANSQRAALANAPLGALVGRISQNRFLVGSACKIEVGPTQTGELRLCANDDLPSKLGENAFKDNTGTLTVTVKVLRNHHIQFADWHI
jgi:hypothetical protein